MIPLAVHQYLQKHRQQQLDKLFELLRIPTVANNNDGSCERAAAWLVDYLNAMGLVARIGTTAGKPVVLAEGHVSDTAPTALIYGHYDVQPAEPLALWRTHPFEPCVSDGNIYARGANDNKGQLFTHLMCLEAFLQSGVRLPVNVKLLLEGEEEIGSPTLEPFIAAHAQILSADAALISDSEFFAAGVPSITYALRGVSNFEVTFQGADHDVHSGIHGGALGNPVHALAKMIAAMHDGHGRVTLDGFYDDVLPLSSSEREEWSKLPFDEKEYAASLGVSALTGGEAGYSVLERRWGRPTIDLNGIVGGYTGAGGKTIIPAQASAKISMRTVPNQDPQEIAQSLKKFVARNTPEGMKSTFTICAVNRPVMLRTDTPAMRAAKAALQEAFGHETAMIRCGASVPVAEMFQRLLGLDAVMMGFGLPDDNLHAPNEKFSLQQLWQGAMASAAMLCNLRDIEV
jgi:acetylornithine deacetylase/succinyl-diaminopimelate desuccinylase-like protein